MPAKEPLTQGSLEKAYYRLRKPDWHGGLDDALSDPIRGRLIRGFARLMQSGQWPSPTPKDEVVPLRTTASTQYRSRNKPSGLDFKSLAAGEKDDD